MTPTIGGVVRSTALIRDSSGTYTGLRIYGQALKAAEIAASFLNGADTL